MSKKLLSITTINSFVLYMTIIVKKKKEIFVFNAKFTCTIKGVQQKQLCK